MRAPRAGQPDHHWLFFFIILLAFILRLWDLDARSLWFDEAMEYWVAQPPLPTAIRALQIGIQDPPLYSLLLHGWLTLGAGDFYLRFPSVCLSVLSVAGMILLARCSFGFAAGIIGGLSMALLPSEIRYAQEIGQYPLMVCALVWNLVALDQLVRQRTRQAYGLWSLTMLAGMYSYYGTLLPLHVPFGLVVLSDLWHGRKTNLLKDGGAAAAYLLGLLPLVLWFIPPQLFRGPAATNAAALEFMPPLAELQTFLVGTQQLISFQLAGWPWTRVPEWMPTVIFAAGFITTVIYALRQPAAPQRRFLFWLTLTLLAYYALIRLHLFSWDEGLYGFRYAMILTPLLLSVMAAGLAQLAERVWLRPISLVLVLGLVVIGIASLPNRQYRDWAFAHTDWNWPETGDIREVTRYWLAQRGSGEPTYVYYGAVAAFRYYLRLNQQDEVSLPPAWFVECWQQKSRAACVADGVYYGSWVGGLPPEKQMHAIEQTLGGSPVRLWLIFANVRAAEDNAIIQQLSARYQIAASYKLKWDSAYLLERR